MRGKGFKFYADQPETYKLFDYITERRLGIFIHTANDSSKQTLIVPFEAPEKAYLMVGEESVDHFLFRAVSMERVDGGISDSKYHIFFSKQGSNKLKVLTIPSNIKYIQNSEISTIHEFKDEVKEGEQEAKPINNL